MKKFFIPFFAALCALGAFAQENANGAGPAVQAIASRGKISAGETIARLAAPAVSNGAPILDKMLVKKGDIVAENQPVAILRGQERARLSLEAAKAAFELTKTESAIRIQNNKNEYGELKGTYEQNLNVLNDKNPPRSEREKISYEQDSLVRKMRQVLDMQKLIEANETNVVARAQIAVKEAEEAHGEYTIKAPFAGEVIELHSKVGEAVSEYGVCEIADTQLMYVEAEVYIGDIKRIKIGAPAECQPEALPNETLSGKVVEISQYVKNNKIFSQDPVEFADQKVIYVKILLDAADKVKTLIGSPVRVKIFVK